MSQQQYPPNGGRGGHNGRGSGQGGRGSGRGGMAPPQQQQQLQQQHQPSQTQAYNNYSTGGRDRGGSRPLGAWPQTQQTQQGSLQQQAAAAAAAAGYQQQQAPPPHGQARALNTAGYPTMGAMPYYSHHYAGAAAPYPAQWQAQQAYVPGPHQQPAARGGVYYPTTAPPVVPTMTVPPIPQAQVPQPIAPREKKPLVITDKDGNVITFTQKQKPVTSSLQAASAAAPPVPVPVKQSTPDAGAKMLEAALARISGKAIDTKSSETADEQKKANEEEKSRIEKETKDRIEQEEEERKQAEEKSRQEAEEKVKLEEAEKEKLRLELEEKLRIETEEKAKADAEEKARLEAEEIAKQEEEEAKASVAKASSQESGDKMTTSSTKRIVISKDDLLRFKTDPQCMIRPSTLPDMTIVKQPVNNNKGTSVGAGQGGGGGGGGDRRNRNSQRENTGGGNWERGGAPPRRQSSQGQQDNRGGGGGGGGGGEWSRGQAPPRQQSQGKGGRGGGRGGRGGGHHQQIMYDGPVAPLVKSENHWKPRKNTSALVVAEKRVKALLNKMTKEKFNVLADQMLEIEISTYEILSMMIDNVYDKAIDEPSFGDIYADLCVRLSQSVQGTEFVHIIESDEEPPTEDGTSAPVAGQSSSHTVYRWSNDVSTSDSEVVGPLPSAEACLETALSGNEQVPVERGEIELELVSVVIRQAIFIKTMKKKKKEDDEGDEYYTVFFPASEAEECGQFLSSIFLSKIECESDAAKKNSFKRSLLNKCEEEFCKQDIYVDWKQEKKEYEESKHKLTEMERREKADELEFRRIRIKKQMLGNVQFIGQLYKKNLLKEKIMRYCIASLLKLDEDKTIKARNPEYNDSGLIDTIDEEDHEAICSLFTTIGERIDKLPAENFMRLCFQKITKLSVEKSLPSRSRFMYKDLIELRGNAWVPRRKEEKAKTIAEIRKDVEIEERRQAEESARAGRGGGNDYRAGGRGQGDVKGGPSRFLPQTQSARPRQAKTQTQTDDDGFSLVSGTRSSIVKGSSHGSTRPRISPSAPTMNRTAFEVLDDEKESPAHASIPALSDDLFRRRVKSMQMDFVSSGGNIIDLMLNVEELSGTPDYGSILVKRSMDSLFESKEAEQVAIARIIITLCEKGKLTKNDVQSGLIDVIEFIDDIAVDAPKANSQLGDILGQMLAIKVIDLVWLCDQLEKPRTNNPQTKAPEEVLRYSLLSLRKAGGPDQSKVPAAEKRIIGLIGAEKWQSLQNSL